jgi:hypothetical protein
MSAADLRQQALEAVRALRDYAPSNGHLYDLAEADALGQMCASAFGACQTAGVTIAEMRAALWGEELASYRAALASTVAGEDEVPPAEPESSADS